MSSRAQLYSITSMDPILDSVGCGDNKLLEAIIGDATGDDVAWATSMLSASPPDNEPGAWNYVVHHLAEHLHLEMNFLELDDWKHYGVWEEYIPRVRESISDPCREMLTMFKDGRPLKGSKVQHDGCCFAWLSADETRQLFTELEKVNGSTLSDDEDIVEFHEELIASFKKATKLGHAIFYAAH